METMAAKNDLKETLIRHLKGGNAFMPVEEILEKMDFNKLGERPNNLPYSFFEIFSHMRFTQKDILDYCLRKDYKAANWPEGYWPQQSAPKDEEEWKALKKSFFEDRRALEELLNTSELTTPVPSEERHSLFREALLVLEHNSYHTGQLLLILRLLDLHS